MEKLKIRKERKLDFLLSLILGILLIAIVLGIYAFINKTSQMKINEKTYQFFHDQPFEFNEDTLLHINEDSSLQLIVEKNEIDVDNSPLYISEKDEFITTVDYILVNYENAKQTYIPNLTRFSIEDKLLKTENHLSYDTENCFLFDGRNTYIILNDMILNLFGEEVAIGALSFIEVDPNNNIRLYNYSKNEMKYYKFNDENISLVNLDKTCVINLFYDSLVAIHGQDVLLFTSPKELEGH